MTLESSVTARKEERWPAVDLWRRRVQGWLRSERIVPVALALILLLGGAFRFTGVNWDNSLHFHPDERHIWMVALSLSLPQSLSEYFDTATSPLNPYNRGSSFVYGTFPLFLTKWLGEGLKLADGEHIHLLGRVLSASFDLLTVLTMFLIGRKLYDARVGLLAAFLAACLVINIQQSHFFTMDSFAATFVALTFYFALRVAERGRWRDFAGMGLSFGLAVACRINVAIVALVMGLAALLRIYNAYRFPVAVAPRVPRERGGLRWEKAFGGVRIAIRVNSHANTLDDPLTEAVATPPAVGTQALSPHWLEMGYNTA
ncbi:MAG: glycosyltransferase family 39 protein, partial [Chloroflexi bacterium]|nr:glycosyltransferase family 39 protein [Chloroflexota bacterium]